MQFDVRRVGSWKVAVLAAKRLDTFVEQELKRRLAEAVTDGTKRLVLDLSQVEFMDSSGICAVVHCQRLMGSDGRIVVAGARPGVLMTLRLTRLDRVFALVDTPERVLASE